MLPFLLTAAFLLQAAAPISASPAPVAVPFAEVEQHMIGESQQLLLPQDGRLTARQKSDLVFGGVTFDLIVDTNGNVISARYQSGVISVPSPVVALAEPIARALHFKPFERNGHAITAEFNHTVFFLPPELKVERHVPFPRVKNWRNVKITLTRPKCYWGHCPVYRVELHGDGSVLYQGESNVVFTGIHHGFVPVANVMDLVKLFEKADYYSLKDEYNCKASDLSTQITSIEIEGHRKQVLDYCGMEMGMSRAAKQLEQDIDNLTGAQRWTQGNSETMAALRSEHWDLHSQEAADALARLVADGKTQAAIDMVNAGVPLNGNGSKTKFNTGMQCCSPLINAAQNGDAAMLRALLDAGAASDPETLGNALATAAESGNLESFHLLLARGAQIKTAHAGRFTVLMGAAYSGSPAVLKEVLQADSNVNFIMPVTPEDCSYYLTQGYSECPKTDGRTALMEAVAAFDDQNIPAEGIDRIEVLNMLLAAGADVNAHDMEGKTPLMYCNYDPARTLILLKAGADPNARDLQGHTAMYYAWGDVGKVLVENGAQPLPTEQSNQ